MHHTIKLQNKAEADYGIENTKVNDYYVMTPKGDSFPDKVSHVTLLKRVDVIDSIKKEFPHEDYWFCEITAAGTERVFFLSRNSASHFYPVNLEILIKQR